MREGSVFRIYTEEKNKRDILRLAAQQFESFTIQPTLGYYKGKAEKSIVIEFVGASERSVTRLALRIQKMNGQKSVLVMKVKAQTKLTRR
jgi:acetolactate synthase regulatory subunit